MTSLLAAPDELSAAVEPDVMVRVSGVRKRFGRRRALAGVDFTIARGRITALVGPNAAGKSTLIKALLGLVRLRRGDGTILVNGQPVGSDYRYRAGIGYMPQAAQFPEHLTCREVLKLLLDVRQRPADPDLGLVERLGLTPWLDRPVGTLSGGTRQKLNAVIAFLFRPALVVLDEPTAGLDPVASAVLKDVVRAAAAGGTTVLLTSHVMSEVEELAQDVIFMVEGQVRFQGTVESLVAGTGETRLERALARLLSDEA